MGEHHEDPLLVDRRAAETKLERGEPARILPRCTDREPELDRILLPARTHHLHIVWPDSQSTSCPADLRQQLLRQTKREREPRR